MSGSVDWEKKLDALALEWANGKSVADVLYSAYALGYHDAVAEDWGEAE